MPKDMEFEEPITSTKNNYSTGKKAWIFLSIVLVFLLLLAVAAIIALAVVLGIERARDEPSLSDSMVCLEQGCVQAGAFIKTSIDESVDPCDDFYQFSCGNWLRSNIVPSDDVAYTTFHEVDDQKTVFLRQALEQEGDGGVEAVEKARNFYKSCLNTNVINSRGATPLLELITNTGGWSLIGIPNAEPWSINGTQLIQEHAYNENGFFSLSVSSDLEDSSTNIIYISQPALSVPPLAYSFIPAREAVKQMYVTLLTLLNSTIEQDVYMRAADKLIDFQSRLVQFLASQQELRDLDRIIMNRFSLGELNSIWPDLDWLSFVRGLLVMGNFNVTVDENEPTIVGTPGYFQSLTSLIRETNNSVLQNHARMNFILHYLNYLGDDFTDLLQTINQILLGTQSEASRDETCAQRTETFYAIAIARPYVNNSVPKGTKETVSMLIDYINEAFKERLEMFTWLDEVTRERSEAKVDAISRFVAYPDQLFDDDYINEIYKDYVADPNNFFGNYVNYLEVQFQQMWSALRVPVDKTSWPPTLAPSVVNAFYSPLANAYLFMSGILNPPFFRADWPDYLNFGAIGAIIGHELTHGFDSIGQRFDKDGNHRQWWTNSSMNAFVSRFDCFINQYNNYSSNGYPENGRLTLEENIADNGGINTAYQAYRNRMNNGGMDKKLPSLDYTPDQLFFIAFGQLWCQILRPEYAAIYSMFNVHSPGQSRANGPLMNSAEFSEAFNCPVGSPMNPPATKKCLLW